MFCADYTTDAEVQAAIQGIQYINGMTNTAAAFEAVKNNCFAPDQDRTGRNPHTKERVKWNGKICEADPGSGKAS